MQNYCKTIGALAAASALVAGNAKAEIEYEIHTGYSSEYLFRGVDLGDGLIEVGVDGATKWNNINLSAGVWGAAFVNATAGTTNDVDNEVDLYSQASYDFGFMTAAVGYIYYWNVGQLGQDAQEVYFQVSRDFGFAAISYTYYGSVQGAKNEGYSELALKRSFDLSPCLKLNLSSTVGYLCEGGDFTAFTNKASLDWGFAEHAKISPFIAVSIALGESSEGGQWADTENEYVAGSMLSVSF